MGFHFKRGVDMETESIAPALGELVSFRSVHGSLLNGICYRREGFETTVIHVHGSLGNFYALPMVSMMASICISHGVNFLSINSSCHDGISEGDRNGQFEYAGGSCSSFEECIQDIEGMVRFAEPFSKRIVLQGHSLGCDRVLHYLISSNRPFDFVLLSPCDSYELQARWIAPETVEDQIRRLRSGGTAYPQFDWLPMREYGVNCGDGWTYEIPITRRAFLSIADGPPFKLINLKTPASFHLRQRALVYIGGKDALQTWPSGNMFDYFRDRIASTTDVYIPQGDHMMANYEAKMSATILDWVMADLSKVIS
jgi:hypothetical protein